MERKFFAFVIPLLAASLLSLTAQDVPATLSLTVDQAVEYALDHNRSVASARYDLLAADKSFLEAVSAGLPSVSGSAGLNDNLKLMTTLLPGEIIGQPGEKVPVTFGSKYNTSFGVSASTAIINVPWIIGMKTAKLATDLSAKGLEQTESDTREGVMTVYYLILVSQETLKVIEANLVNLNEVLASTRAMYSVGMAEATDVDQMLSTVSNLLNTKTSMERAQSVNYNLMRFMLGVGRDTEIHLTQTLEAILADVSVDELLTQDFTIEDNISYKLIEGQVRMSELSLSGVQSISPAVTFRLNILQ
ncbi:MAG: TolC family protein [Marinilabiliales bacterium]|nr:TolC family protein [Marinilabiliales bacterium]